VTCHQLGPVPRSDQEGMTVPCFSRVLNKPVRPHHGQSIRREGDPYPVTGTGSRRRPHQLHIQNFPAFKAGVCM